MRAAATRRRRSCAASSARGARRDAARPRPRRARRRRRRSSAHLRRAHGGFGDAPKFPRPSELLFLLREHARDRRARDAPRHGARDAAARWRSAACATTSAAASTAIRSTPTGACRTSRRCSTTRRSSCWPARSIAGGGDRFFADVAEDTLIYVLRDLTDAAGGFYSAEDADSVPPEQAGEPARTQDGGRVLHLARRRDRRRCSAAMPTIVRAALRRPAGRQRALRPAAASSPARTCCTPRDRRG